MRKSEGYNRDCGIVVLVSNMTSVVMEMLATTAKNKRLFDKVPGIGIFVEKYLAYGKKHINFTW